MQAGKNQQIVSGAQKQEGAERDGRGEAGRRGVGWVGEYEYENEAASPQRADTGRVLSPMSVTSNKRSPPHRALHLSDNLPHVTACEAGEGGASGG